MKISQSIIGLSFMEILRKYYPLAHGKGFDMIRYVDVDLTGNKITRRSRTGFILFLYQSPIY